jgi:hypothetical protein
MKPPTDPPTPPAPADKNRQEGASARQVPEDPSSERGSAKRPGGHGSYKLGGEPAIGQRWHEAPPPPPATMTRFDDTDDGVPHRPHPPGDDDPLHNEDIDHEHRDVNVKAVISSAIVLAVVALGSQLAMWLLFGFFESQAAGRDPELSPLQAPAVEMPKNTRESPFFNPSVGGPQLMTNEPMGLANVTGAEQKRLQGYGWVNQAGGVAFIPIEEAKKLLRERGVPVREGGAVAPDLGTRLPARGEASGGRVITTTPSGEPSATPEAAPAPGEKPHQEAPAAKPRGPGGH